MSKAPKRAQMQVERLFVDMSGREKMAFLAKALVFFASGGFIYPTLWVD